MTHHVDVFGTLNKTATDNITNIIARVKDAILDNFYIDDYLDAFDTKEEAIETSETLSQLSKQEVSDSPSGYPTIRKP